MGSCDLKGVKGWGGEGDRGGSQEAEQLGRGQAVINKQLLFG